MPPDNVVQLPAIWEGETTELERPAPPVPSGRSAWRGAVPFLLWGLTVVLIACVVLGR